MHADFIELGPHQGVAGDRSEITAVHDLRHMVAGNTPPVGDSRSTVLITAGVSAIGISLHMSDQDGNITVIDIFVHQHRIAPAGSPEVNEVVIVLTVMVHDLAGGIELIEKLVTQDAPYLKDRVLPVKAVGAD